MEKHEHWKCIGCKAVLEVFGGSSTDQSPCWRTCLSCGKYRLQSRISALEVAEREK